MLADKLTNQLQGRSACLLIDGQPWVVSIGKPIGARTFGDLADPFTSSVLQSGVLYALIFVVFDKYRD